MTGPGQTRERVAVEVLTDPVAFARLEPEWNSLLAASGSDTIFLTWEWTTVWWSVYGGGRRLHLMTARDAGGRLVGLAPLQRTARLGGSAAMDTVEFIGAGGDVTPEYLDFVICEGWESTVVQAFVDGLLHENSVKVLLLRPFAARSPNRAHIERALAARPGRLVVDRHSVCPVFPLPDSVEAFRSSQSANYRKKLGEYERRCAKDLQPTLRTSSTEEELERDMTTLATLHRQRWDGASRAFATADYLTFHTTLARQMLRKGWLRLYSFESLGTPAAVIYNFAYANRHYFYQSGRHPGFSKYRVGLVLMHRVIQDAIGEGALEFDFLRGREEYKYRWATSEGVNLQLVFCTSRSARLAHDLAEFIEKLRLKDWSSQFKGVGAW